MSMWSVPDKETKELMVEFYRNALSGKINRCQALRQAALKQMQISKDRYGHTNPLYWGAFVFWVNLENSMYCESLDSCQVFATISLNG